MVLHLPTWNCALQSFHFLPQKHYPQDKPSFQPALGPKKEGLHQLLRAFALSHPADSTMSEHKGGLCFRRFLRDASNSKSPEIRQGRKLAFPTRQHGYILMEDSCCLGDCESPVPCHLLKCTSSIFRLQVWEILFREAHMNPFACNLVS